MLEEMSGPVKIGSLNIRRRKYWKRLTRLHTGLTIESSGPDDECFLTTASG